MNNIKATIVADSINNKGDRITSMLVTFPRFILAELNTHRLFSRNSASSRAIPFEKMVQSIKENPFIPIAWQKEHKGMQGTEYITETKGIEYCKNLWLKARDRAINSAKDLNDKNAYPKGDFDPSFNVGVTKQLCNRLLEPFMYHTVLITATEWSNFFELRCPQYSITSQVYKSWKELSNSIADLEVTKSMVDSANTITKIKLNKGQSEIHMMDLAEKMYDAINESTPKLLKEGEYHIPFGDNIDTIQLQNLYKKYKASGYNPDNPTPDEYYYEGLDDLKIKIAIARCARTSYTIFGEEKSDNYEADLKLFDRLKESGHASPMEHIAQVMTIEEYENNYIIENGIKTKGISRNFKGFKQYRQIINL